MAYTQRVATIAFDVVVSLSTKFQEAGNSWWPIDLHHALFGVENSPELLKRLNSRYEYPPTND